MVIFWVSGSILVFWSMDNSTPPPTSTTTDQRVIELSTQVEEMKEKCVRYDVEMKEKCVCYYAEMKEKCAYYDAEMRLMRRMLTSLYPSFPNLSTVRSLNAKYVHLVIPWFFFLHT